MKNIKILYVEDDYMTNSITSAILKAEYRNVYTEMNGVNGLERFRKESPDIVITDLSMPRMDGFEMVHKIRQINPKTPVIVTTAYTEESSHLTNVTVLHKPIEIDILLEKIDELLRS